MLPPHVPDPHADPIALLEARIVEQDDIIASQYRELTAWRSQLEAALMKISEIEAQRDAMLEAAEMWRAASKQIALGMADGLEAP